MVVALCSRYTKGQFSNGSYFFTTHYPSKFYTYLLLFKISVVKNVLVFFFNFIFYVNYKNYKNCINNHTLIWYCKLKIRNVWFKKCLVKNRNIHRYKINTLGEFGWNHFRWEPFNYKQTVDGCPRVFKLLCIIF